jgi:hypothetical protein
MKVFEIALPGNTGKLIVAENEKKAHERRGELDPSFEFLPVEVNELKVEGFNIFAEPIEKKVKEPETPPKNPKTLEKPPEQPKQEKPKGNKGNKANKGNGQKADKQKSKE